MKEKSLVSPKEFNTARQIGLFRKLKEKFFTGELIIQNIKGTESEFHLYMGRVVYATGGIHPLRRYRRLLSLYCPERLKELSTNPEQILQSRETQERGMSYEYLLLSTWLQKGTLSRSQAVQLTKTLLGEILFDLSLAGKVTYNLQLSSLNISPPTFIDPEQAITETSDFWNAWHNTELKAFSPNLAPLVKEPQELKKRVSSEQYEILTAQGNREQSLRELSTYLEQDLVSLAHTLSGHILEGLIELVEIPDLPDLIV